MAPGRFNDAVPKPQWICKICSKRVNRSWRFSGALNYCRDCDNKKGDCFGGKVEPSSPSVSRVHPPRTSGPAQSTAAAKELEKVKLRNKELERQLALSNKAAATGPSEEAVVIVDDGMDTTEPDEFEHTIKELEDCIKVLDPARPRSMEKIVQYRKQIAIQREAERAAKPPRKQLQFADREIAGLHKKEAKLAARTEELSAAANAAHRQLNEHLGEVAKIQDDITKATQRRELLAKRLRADDLAAASPDLALDASNALLHLHAILKQCGVNNALPGVSEEARAALAAVFQKAGDEAEARAA